MLCVCVCLLLLRWNRLQDKERARLRHVAAAMSTTMYGCALARCRHALHISQEWCKVVAVSSVVALLREGFLPCLIDCMPDVAAMSFI